MTPGIEVIIRGETWRTTGETKSDYDQILIAVEAPTYAGGTRKLWVSEDDYIYYLGE